jgi:predicted O-linked N-acetylglucosamine transferase (SPINDLY family)
MSITSNEFDKEKFDQAKDYFLLSIEKFNKGLLEEAERLLFLSLDLLPNRLNTLTNLSAVLMRQEKLEQAHDILTKAIALYPREATLYFYQGHIFSKTKNLTLALSSYHTAMELNAHYEYITGYILHTKMLMCIWEDLGINLKTLVDGINEHKKLSLCFPLLALSDDSNLQLFTSEIWVNDKYPLQIGLGDSHVSLKKNKIRIGYYSSDFNEHPVAYLTAELFELHDRSKFEVIAFSFGSSNYSEFCKRVSSAFCRFIDITKLSDKDVALLSRDIGIDIAIDLTGHTTNERVGIFSYRAAPIQLSYLGYLGTMGAQYYDYLLADKIIIPPQNQQYYCEKIVYLPSYQVNDSKRKIADKAFTRAELNLPESGFVFCCFNNNYKITPSTFAGWMRILTAVPDSVLFLFADNKWAEENLKIEAENRGVCQTRLVFGARINRSEYLARYRVADLFLDTLPYNAGTTASDALWAGLPVLTCMGESFASRVAASLLNAIELTELITNSQHQYEATAIELATNPTKLKAVKDKLQRNRLTTALFDTKLFTKNIEAAYTEMYKRYQNNSPPEHIYL